MLRIILKAFNRQNMPDKSLSTAVATLIAISSGVGASTYQSKEEMLAAAIGAAVAVILFFFEDRKKQVCEVPPAAPVSKPADVDASN